MYRIVHRNSSTYTDQTFPKKKKNIQHSNASKSGYSCTLFSPKPSDEASLVQTALHSQYSNESSNKLLNCSLSSPISSLKDGANINTRLCGSVPSTKSSICSLPNPKSFNPLG